MTVKMCFNSDTFRQVPSAPPLGGAFFCPGCCRHHVASYHVSGGKRYHVVFADMRFTASSSSSGRVAVSDEKQNE